MAVAADGAGVGDGSEREDTRTAGGGPRQAWAAVRMTATDPVGVAEWVVAILRRVAAVSDATAVAACWFRSARCSF